MEIEFVHDRRGKCRILDSRVFKDHKPHLLFCNGPCLPKTNSKTLYILGYDLGVAVSTL